MTNIQFRGMPTDEARALQRGGKDSNGQVAENAVSDGVGNPCRHCMQMIGEDVPMLVVAHRPFTTVQPYAEMGPIFLHAEECDAYEVEGNELPPVLEDSPEYIVRGYDADEKIVYRTGKVTPQENIIARSADLLKRNDLQFLHVRSATNNCWQARVERTQDS